MSTGNAAAVVHDRHRIIDVDRDVDLVAVAGERLVDRVVHDFVDEVVEPGRTGRADVHRRTLADRLEALEDLDFVGAVVVRVAAVAVGRGRRRVLRGDVRIERPRLIVLRFSSDIDCACVRFDSPGCGARAIGARGHRIGNRPQGGRSDRQTLIGMIT